MSEWCSTSACNDVQDPNRRDSLQDCADISENPEHHPLRDENEVEEDNKELPQEEDEEEDVDFNPFLKENNSVEASSSLSSEVEDLDTDVADSREKSCTAFDRDSTDKERDNIRETQTSGNVDHGEDVVTMQTTFSPEEVSASTIYKESAVITPSENEFLCDKENGSATQPMVDMDDDDEGAICMRTRARYSLASFTLDELETFLQESDDEDDLQNVDDEEEYRKFLAGVLRGDDSENLIGNGNVDEEDEENDADFELELEEALESEPEEVEVRRKTRRIRCQKSSLERSKKLSGKSNRPLRPLLPFPAIGSFPAYDGNRIMPNMAPSYVPHVNNGATCAFTPHQIGQLHCLIHEHVQLLIQVFSLSVLEPGKSNTAAEVKKLVVEMLKKRDQSLTWRTVPHPGFCFFPPYVHPSVSDGLQRILLPKGSNGNVQREISASSNTDLHADAVSLTSGRNMHLPDDLGSSFQTPECPLLWVPYVCGPKLSVVDVAPLRLVENFIDDISSAVRAYERHQIELGFESGCQKESLFPLHNFPCSAGSDGQGEMENNPPDSSGVPCSSPSKQMARKTMAANLLEKAKNQPVASVPKVIARVAQRFWPFFNPALYPHKPPPAAIVNRVLFTDAEDELLALGLMEYNTDWKAIQQRFLPCKSRHQIFVRQKNRASSKTPENPIKAVRRMKNSPLTSEEISLIEMGIKRFKLDWMSIWSSFVPYRDPSLLPRQWRIACGTQKSYISDPNKNAKRRLNDIRRTSRVAPSTRHSSSEKEGDSTDNAVEDPNISDNRIDKEDEAYVHEAFLADWRPGDNNVSSSIPTCMPTHAGSIQSPIRSKYPAALSSQVVLRPYRSRKPNSARLVKLAPGLPPVNLPPSVRVMSQSAFKSSQAEPSLKPTANAYRIADLADSSVKSGPSRNHPVNSQPTHSDLQLHPLLFQAPQDGRLSYYQANGNTSTPSSFAFFPGKQTQLSLGPFHNPRHIRDAMHFFSKSSIPPGENTSSTFGADFHPLLQRTDDVDTHSVGATPACPIAEARQGCTLIQDGNSSASGKKDKELDLDIHLSSTSKNQKAAGNRCETGRLRSAKDSGKKRVSGRDGISDELNSGDIPRVMPRNKGSRKASDATCDESLPEIIMEQEELSDSEDEFGENVEFECEEMADSEGESMSDSEQIVAIPNEEVQQVEMGADIVDDSRVPKTRNDCEGNNTCSTSGGLLSGLEPAGKGGANIKTNVSYLNLNSCPPISPLPNPKNVKPGYDFGPFGTAVMFGQNQQLPASSKESSRRLKLDSRRNPRKRICRSNSNPSAVAGSGKGKTKPNIYTSVENMKNVSTEKNG